MKPWQQESEAQRGFTCSRLWLVAATEFLYGKNLVVLSLRKVRSFISRVEIPVDQWQSRVCDRWGWILKQPSLPHRPMSLLRDLLTDKAEFKPRLPWPYFRHSWLSCHNTEIPDGSAVFFKLPKAALQENHLPWLSEEPTHSLQQGWGGRRCWTGPVSRSLSPLNFTIFSWYSLKKLNQIGLKSADLSSVTHTELLGYKLFFQRLLHSIIFKNLIA